MGLRYWYVCYFCRPIGKTGGECTVTICPDEQSEAKPIVEVRHPQGRNFATTLEARKFCMRLQNEEKRVGGVGWIEFSADGVVIIDQQI